MNELQRRSDRRRLLAQRSQVTRRMEVEALTRARKGITMTMTKRVRGEILMIKLLRK